MTKKHLFAATAATVTTLISATGCGDSSRVNVSSSVGAVSPDTTESTPYTARYKVEEFHYEGQPATETFYIEVDFDDATNWNVVTTDESGGNTGRYGGQRFVRSDTTYEQWSHSYNLRDVLTDEELATAIELLDTNEQMQAVQSIIDSGALEYRSTQNFSLEVDRSDRGYDVPFDMTALAPPTHGKTAAAYWHDAAQSAEPGPDGTTTFTVNGSIITANHDGVVTHVAEPFEGFRRTYTLEQFEWKAKQPATSS